MNATAMNNSPMPVSDIGIPLYIAPTPSAPARYHERQDRQSILADAQEGKQGLSSLHRRGLLLSERNLYELAPISCDAQQPYRGVYIPHTAKTGICFSWSLHLKTHRVMQ